MRIILCSTAINALGETFTLASFAKELEASGNMCYFIAPKLGHDYLLTFGFEESQILLLKRGIEKDNKTINLDSNYSVFKEFVKKVNPELVIVADWHHYKLNGLSNNASYSIYWFDDNIHIVTFDHLGFAPNGRKVEFNKILSQDTTELNSDTTKRDFIPLSDRYCNIIRPCPHHKNTISQYDNIFYWGIYKDILQKEKSSKHMRHNFAGSKIIFQPIGFWQERVFRAMLGRLNLNYDYYFETMIPIMLYYLTKFDENFTYILISESISQIKEYKQENTNVVLLPPQKHSEFMNYLNIADLFLTDNLMSSNLSKAVFNNIPSLTLRNSIYTNNELVLNSSFNITQKVRNYISPMIESNMLFPYYSFPLGLCELEDMYQDNNFSDCFDISELYDELGCTKILGNILFDKTHIATQLDNQSNYIRQNQKLMSANEIINAIL